MSNLFAQAFYAVGMGLWFCIDHSQQGAARVGEKIQDTFGPHAFRCQSRSVIKRAPRLENT